MNRKDLKALSWDQSVDKIWTILLLGVIYTAISSAASGTVGSIVGVPVGVLAGIVSAGVKQPELAAAIKQLASSFAGTLTSALSIFIVAPFIYSFKMVFLNITKGTAPQVVDLFAGFKKYWRAIGVYFFNNLFIALWTLLFIIPGIVKIYSYAMAHYIAIEHPELSPLDCITKSKKMMNGHKMDLFILDLSFIGWGLLSIVSCCIAGIWLFPYFHTSRANFYRQLKGEI